MKVTLKQMFLALAKQVPEGNKDGGKLIANPNKTWKDVDPSLPNTKISQVRRRPPVRAMPSTNSRSKAAARLSRRSKR